MCSGLFIPVLHRHLVAGRISDPGNHVRRREPFVADVSRNSRLFDAYRDGEVSRLDTSGSEEISELHSPSYQTGITGASGEIPCWFLNMTLWHASFRAMPNLRELRETKGLTQAELARLVGTSQPQIQRLENSQRTLTKKWAQRLSPHLGVDARNLMFEDVSLFREVVGLPVAGVSRAGDWLDITVIDDAEVEMIPVAKDPRFQRARQYALLVQGDSMNRIFSEGSYVTCVDFAESGLPIRPKMIVHVERTISGRQLVETTLKQVVETGGAVELHPMSTNPIHKPIILDGDDDTEIRVKGVVIGKWEPIEFEDF